MSNEKDLKTDVSMKVNLEEDAKLKVSIIGAGNAGNQIIEKAYVHDYDVFAINSSIKDLSDMVIRETVPSFIIGHEARGAGKNRSHAKTLFRENGKTLFKTDAFIDMIDDSDIIFVVASTAGGTGSGIAPELIHILKQMYPNKIVIFYGITPKLSDSIISQSNTIQCLDEIHGLNIPYMLADLSYYEDTPNDIAYNEIGKHMVDNMNAIRGDFLHHSDSGMIDENDMRVLIGEPGYLSIYSLNKVTQSQVDQKSIQSHLIERIKQSPAVSLQRDGMLKQMGVIINCPEEMKEASKTGNYNELTSYIGMPLSIFENYAITSGTSGQFIIILSGMNLPYTRIMQAKQKIDDHEDHLKRVKHIDLKSDVDDIGFLNQSTGFQLNGKPEKDNQVLDSYFD